MPTARTVVTVSAICLGTMFVLETLAVNGYFDWRASLVPNLRSGSTALAGA